MCFQTPMRIHLSKLNTVHLLHHQPVRIELFAVPDLSKSKRCLKIFLTTIARKNLFIYDDCVRN